MNGNSYGNGYSGGIRRGDIFYADLSPVVGSEQGGLRPVLIIQNDVGNRYSPTVIAAAITSRIGKTHQWIWFFGWDRQWSRWQGYEDRRLLLRPDERVCQCYG